MIIPVILSGGAGTRLWPLSTSGQPKQFLPLIGERTLFQETLIRLEGLDDLAPPIVVCNEMHGDLVVEQLRELGINAGAILLEPAGRNTAPAIGVVAELFSAAAPASASFRAIAGSDAEPMLLVLPADHIIADTSAFHAAVASAVRAARTGRLVTFGIVPTAPETGYGYIEQGVKEGEWSRVAGFVEKPDADTARSCIDSGRFLWNSGMFMFPADIYLAELARCSSDIRAACIRSAASITRDRGFARLGDAFLACPSNSIDYAVMEKTDRAAVVPLDAGWSDVGSWDALFDALAANQDGNVLRGNVTVLDAHDNLVIGDSRNIALLGVDDLVVVDSGDSLLIMRRDQSQRVKELLDRVKVNSS